MDLLTEALKRKAQLETENDLLRAELEYLDRLMRLAGFSNGIETVKATALEIINNPQEYPQEIDEYFEEDEAA